MACKERENYTFYEFDTVLYLLHLLLLNNWECYSNIDGIYILHFLKVFGWKVFGWKTFMIVFLGKSH